MPVAEKTFNEWSIKVLEELVSLNAKYENLAKEIDEQHASIEMKIDKINYLLNGNGDPSKGLIVRVDRLEQLAENQEWWRRSTVGAAIVAVITSIGSLLKWHQ